MTWSLDTSTQGTYGITDPATLSHTCSASTKLLTLVIFVNGTTARTGGAPTYNGTPLTDSGQGFVFDSGGEAGVEIWYLIDPDTGGSYTVSAPNTGALNLDLSVSSWEPSGGGAAFGVSNSATGTTADPSVTVNSVTANNLMIGGLGHGYRNVPAAGANYTLIHTQDAGNVTWGSEYDLDTGASGNIVVDFVQNADDWGLIGIAFEEVSSTPASDNSSAYIQGQDTSSDNSSAYIQGQDTSSDRKGAYLSGTMASADSKSSYIAGQASASSQLAGYIAGGLAASDSKSAYIAGVGTASDSKSAYVSGVGTASDSKSAYIAAATTCPVIEISGGQGRLSTCNDAASYARVRAHATATSDVEALLKFTLTDVTAESRFRVFIRSSNDWDSDVTPTQAYELLLPNSSATYQINRIELGSRSLIGSGSRTNDTNAWWVRFQAFGPMIRFRIWADGGGEPATWDEEIDDSGSGFTDAGVLQISLNTESIGAEHTVLFDDVSYHAPVNQAIDSSAAYIEGFDTATDSQNAYIAGGVDAADSQDAYIVGADTASDRSEAYIAGTDTAGDSKSAYIAGTDTAGDSSEAYIAGGVNVDDSTEAYVAGTATASSSISAFISSLEVTTDSKSAYIAGIDTTSDSQEAYIAGGVDVSDSKSAYINSRVPASDSKSAYTAGRVPSNGVVPAYIRGQDTDSDSQEAYISGGLTSTDSASAYIHGQDTVSDSSEAYIQGVAGASADSKSAYIHGQDAVSDSNEAYIQGQDTTSDSNEAYIQGQLGSSDSQPAYIAGIASVASGQQAYIAGTASTASSQQAYVVGGIVEASSKSAYIDGVITGGESTYKGMWRGMAKGMR